MTSLVKELKGISSNNIIASNVTEAEGNSLVIDNKNINILSAKVVEVDGMDSYIFFVGKDNDDTIFGLVPTWTLKGKAVTGYMSYLGKDQKEGKEEFLKEGFEAIQSTQNMNFTVGQSSKIEVKGKIHEFVPQFVIEEFNIVVGFEKRNYNVEMPIIIESNTVWLPLGEDQY
ncbi:MAG: hypothetical protein ACK4NC_07065 [Candidatus Gracilibacteria bacterium]